MYPSVCLFAESGFGKSTLALQFNPEKVRYIGTEREAIAPGLSKLLNPHWPKLPMYQECLSVDRPFEELFKVAQEAARDQSRPIVVLDTLSSWADREMGRIHRDGVPDAYGRASALLHERLTTIINTILLAGNIFIALAHQKEPSLIESKFSKGGPRMPGKSSAIIPSLFSMVLRGDVEMGDDMKKRRVFRVDPLDSRYFSKDRYNVVADGADADLLGAVRAAVQSIRAVGL